MAGRTFIPKGDKEELLYYKGIYQIKQDIEERLKLMGRLNEVDHRIASRVATIKRFLSWRELGEMLGMTETQANKYLSPLMENERIESPDE